ncbi:MAG: hypothetical protein KIS81_08240 [Maricaulaceae bacterium]|nr:hypothetical protein [Maricaulaceae bacterium]
MTAMLAALLLAFQAIILPEAGQTPAQRLDARLSALSAAADEEAAAPLVDEITALWADAGSPTIALLMDRAAAARAAGDPGLAARMYGHVHDLAPDYSEGWLRAAELAMARDDWAFAFEALNEALLAEPRRFDAYAMLARVLERAGAAEAALEAYEEALGIHPVYAPAQAGAARLRAAREGRPL